MTPEVINLTCPGCGAPIATGYKECESCGRPLVVQSFKTFIDMDKPLTNKYVNEYRKILSVDPYNPEINKSMGMALLKLGLYDQSTKMLDNAATYDLSDADSCFFSAISRLNGKRPAFVKRNVLDEVIQRISAAKLIENKGIYDYMLAVIKYDYFCRKGFNVSPSFDEHMDEAEANGLSQSDIDELDSILGFKTQELPDID